MTDQTPTIQGDGGPLESVPVVLVSPTGEPYGAEPCFFAAMSMSGIVAGGFAILVDLSDTTNFPHDIVGGIYASGVYLSVDRDNTATGDLFLGVITRIDGASADISYLQGFHFEKANDQSVFRDRVYGPDNLLSFEVSGGQLVGSITGAKLTTTSVNTGVTLASPRGAATVVPAVGDIIVGWRHTAGEYSFAASMQYLVKEPVA